MSMFPTMADSAADIVRVKNIVFEMGSGASQVLLSLGNVFRVLLPSMTWFYVVAILQRVLRKETWAKVNPLFSLADGVIQLLNHILEPMEYVNI